MSGTEAEYVDSCSHPMTTQPTTSAQISVLTSLKLHSITRSVDVEAQPSGLTIRSKEANYHLTRRDDWPPAALSTPEGLRVALQLEQCFEMGLAEQVDDGACCPYDSFLQIHRLNFELTRLWTDWSPFLLEIDRTSDLGRKDFYYKYRFKLGSDEVPLERIGYYVRRVATGTIYHLDDQTYALVSAMDQFNSLPEDRKTKSASWLTFAKVKGCAEAVGADLDRYLASNDVVIPSRIALDIFPHRDGSISFVPRCKEISSDGFREAFLRNPDEQNVYSIDLAGNRRVRVVLDDEQREVLRRMKQAQHLRGEAKRSAIEHPEQYFDGVLDSVILPYGRRVEGIGEFDFMSVPAPPKRKETIFTLGLPDELPSTPQAESSYQVPTHIECKEHGTNAPIRIDFPNQSGLRGFRELVGRAIANGTHSLHYEGRELIADEDLYKALGEGPTSSTDASPIKEGHKAKKYLLIYTDEEQLKDWDQQTVQDASRPIEQSLQFERPASLLDEVKLKPHQVQGVEWLQNCHRLKPQRRGSLLADDMGLGKTLQLLTYVAWSIENDPDLGLNSPAAPWRPVLVIVPLVVLENEVWQSEIKRFFKADGAVFEPVLAFHGNTVKAFKRKDTVGREVVVGKSVLEIERFMDYRLVITNYETIVNYQHSFAQLIEGKPIWSILITDEAQEYKTPSTKISHAIKALDPKMRLACTGTPVENRLLDLWNLMDSLQPALLGTAKEFTRNFESADENEAVAKLEALRERLLFGKPNAFVVRRDKSELSDLPPKQITVVDCPMSDFEIAMHSQLLKMLPEHRRQGTHLSILHRLVQLYQHPHLLKEDQGFLDPDRLLQESSKLKTVVEILSRVRDRREKAVVFSRFVNMQQILAAVLSKIFDLNVQIINGSPSQQEGVKSSATTSRSKQARKQILDNFRSKPGFNVIVLSPFVAGIGLTITEANHVIHYGRWWNPAVEAQATDRVYRIGQERDVHVYLPTLTDPSGRISTSFDQRLHCILDQKSTLASEFLRPTGDEQGCATELCDSLLADEINKGTPLQPLSMDDVDRLSPLDFEALIAALFDSMGHVSVLTAAGNDGGADVVAFRHGEITLVQVKHSHSGLHVGKAAIGDLVGASNTYNVALRHSVRMAVVTNTRLASDADAECRSLGIDIVTRAELARNLKQHPILLTDVLKKSDERCTSFVDGIRKLGVILNG